MPSGLDELCAEFREARDGRDCVFNVLVNIAECRGLYGLASHGFNDSKARVYGTWDPEGTEVSKIHSKTSTPFFNFVCKLSYVGQPHRFLSSSIVIEIQHDRGLLPAKIIGVLQIGVLDVFHSSGHKLPLQWFAINDIASDEPAIPTGYIRMNVIINNMDEPGAVQDDVPEEERSRCELLEIPRLHNFITATGVYNIIFKIYQARNLRRVDDTWGSDPFIKIVIPTGENQTDTKASDLNPVWNQQLQIPVYEPIFCDLLALQLWNQNIAGNHVVAEHMFSWKDVFSRQEYYKQPRWFDLFALPDKGIMERTAEKVQSITRKVGEFVGNRQFKMMASKICSGFGSGSYEEPSVYCGRVLLSIEIEDREGSKAQPSLALTEMKPKDCKLFQDVKQKVFFRFHVFHGQGLNVPAVGMGQNCYAQVELEIGRKSCTTKVKSEHKGLFEWYQAVELEDDIPYDDQLWPWLDTDYEEGYFPSELIDAAFPPVWIKVYRCSGLLDTIGGAKLTRKLIGFKKLRLRDLLAIGERPAAPVVNAMGKPTIMELTQGNQKANVILNKKDSSLPSFYVAPSEELPKEWNPRERSYFKPTYTSPPWPHGDKFDDGRGNNHSMDPYIGMQCIKLDRDATCDLEPTDFAGFIWVSLKMYVPSRTNCSNAVKGPPILSPFVKFNEISIPSPQQLKCEEIFSLRAHISQAKDLPSANTVGMANAFVEVVFCGKKMRTHTVNGSNSPTWDCTLSGASFNDFLLPSVGWPGCDDFGSDQYYEGLYEKYNPKDDDWPEDGLQYSYGNEDYALRWLRNYNMLRAAPRIEVRVLEKVASKNVLLGRFFVAPERCFHTHCDPSWFELFKGNPEIDEGKLYASFQIVHRDDPLFKVIPGELVPQRTDEFHNSKGNKQFVEPNAWKWDPNDGVPIPWESFPIPFAFFSRTRMPCRGYNPFPCPMNPYVEAAEVFMRECRIQVQILGLRNMSEQLGLSSPSLAFFVQTTDSWNGDPAGFKVTKECSLPNPNDVNFMQQLELEVLLPDDPEYAPDLEFLVFDYQGFFGGRKIVCWGSEPLRLFYPCGVKEDNADDNDDDEDEAARLRREKVERRKKFEELMEELMKAGTIQAKEAKKLLNHFKSGMSKDLDHAFDLYLAAPSEAAFLERTEEFLLTREMKDIEAKEKALEKKRKKDEERQRKEEAKEKEREEKEAKKKKAEEEKQKKLELLQEKKEKQAAEKAAKLEAKKAEKLAKQLAKEAERMEKEAAAASLTNSRKKGTEGDKGGDAVQTSPEEVRMTLTTDVMEEGREVKVVLASDDDKEGEGEDGVNEEGALDEADAVEEEADANPEGGEHYHEEGGETYEDETPMAEHEEQAELQQAEEERLADELHLGDKGPSDQHEEVGDNPNQAVYETAGGGGAGAGAGAGAGGGDEVGEGDEVLDVVDIYSAIRPEDDEEPDRQEVIDTPDGKPNAEWLVFRKHTKFTEPLEKTKEWTDLFEPSFEEVPLFQGRVRDYKRRNAEAVGVVKCRIKVFRKENETKAGKSELNPERDPEYFEVVSSDPSIPDALEKCRPYKQYNIYETFAEATVEVRVYCLKAFQVTPGGFMREENGEGMWLQYLEARLGDKKHESDVVKSLNPNFFHVFQFADCVIPGPSQLVITLLDASIAPQGMILSTKKIGTTTIDLEDRWFCQEWRDEKYKPREVRDLINEEELPGVSQGKLSLFLDIVDETKAAEQPVEDIKVLGKTLPMELRVIIWNTLDTAPKDSYTSDVYISCELLGVGQPKMTDTHYGVKVKAYGMFNYRLKWKCKFPEMNLEYLMRISVWDENALTSHKSIAEGVLPLKKLFKDCFERNQGKTSPDDMEFVFMTPRDMGQDTDADKQVLVDEENFKYPYIWYKMVHPNFGFNREKNSQAKLQLSIQVMPRAKARANPAGRARNGPSKLAEPGRPPQPANPILESEKCKAYIVYSIKEFFGRCKGTCMCLCCCLICGLILAAIAGIQMAFPGLLPIPG